VDPNQGGPDHDVVYDPVAKPRMIRLSRVQEGSAIKNVDVRHAECSAVRICPHEGACFPVRLTRAPAAMTCSVQRSAGDKL
jgi:hypothetical protein